MKKTISMLFCAVLLSACAASGPGFIPAERPTKDTALLYVYRQPGFVYGARTAKFYINDVNVFDLDQQGYSWIAVPAGTYQLKQKWSSMLPSDLFQNSLAMNIELKAGETRYFSLNTDMCAGNGMNLCLQQAVRPESEAVGVAQIASKRFQNNFGLQALNNALSKP